MQTGRSVQFLCWFVLLSSLAGLAQAADNDVSVTRSNKDPLQLQISLRSRAKHRTAVYKSDLPWGIRDSIVLVAVWPNGESLQPLPIAGDPSPEEVSVGPDQVLTGRVDLRKVFREIDSAIKKSDIHIFWAYSAPKQLGLPRWSGGWILIPKQNK
jgi:hypothetical protein